MGSKDSSEGFRAEKLTGSPSSQSAKSEEKFSTRNLQTGSYIVLGLYSADA